MVSARRPAAALVAAIVLIMALGAACPADEEKPTVTETYSVTVNDVGDGHIIDTIKYSKEDYAAVKKVEKKKRGFLTRRFTSEDTTGEVVDFKTEMNDSAHSVVITYEKPGMAYCTEGEWVLYGGFTSKPKSSSGNRYTFVETSTINSEFTLFTDQVIRTTTEIVLPGAARGIKYDSKDDALRYKMPPAGTLYGFWSENRITMSLVFGLLTLLFAGLLGFVATRNTAGSAAVVPVAAAPADGVPPAGKASGSPAEDTPEAGRRHGFCAHCGAQVSEGKSFCTNCGAKVD